MKKMYFLAVIMFTATIGFGQSSDLKITGIADADLPGGLPKAMELYVINDISDLSIYGFGSANNGGGTDEVEFTFPAESASAGTFIYIASETVQFNLFFGFDPDYTSSAIEVNGDDAVELFMNDVVVDVFGDINKDGSGEAWEYKDGWAYVNNDSEPNDGTFNINNWTISNGALDTFTTNASATSPFPIGSFTYSSGALSNDIFTKAEISLFPVPANNSLTFKSEIKTSGVFEVFNTSGQLLLNAKGNLSNKVLDVSKLSKGSYILKVSSEGESHSYKFTK